MRTVTYDTTIQEQYRSEENPYTYLFQILANAINRDLHLHSHVATTFSEENWLSIREHYDALHGPGGYHLVFNTYPYSSLGRQRVISQVGSVEERNFRPQRVEPFMVHLTRNNETFVGPNLLSYTRGRYASDQGLARDLADELNSGLTYLGWSKMDYRGGNDNMGLSYPPGFPITDRESIRLWVDRNKVWVYNNLAIIGTNYIGTTLHQVYWSLIRALGRRLPTRMEIPEEMPGPGLDQMNPEQQQAFVERVVSMARNWAMIVKGQSLDQHKQQVDAAVQMTESAKQTFVQARFEMDRLMALTATIEAHVNSGSEPDLMSLRHMLNDGLITGIDFQAVGIGGPSVVVYTKELHARDDRTDKYHNIGRMKITINPRSGGINFKNLDRRVDGYQNGMHAPHVFANGSACTGNFAEMMADLVNEGDWIGMIQMGIAFIESANTRDSAGQYVSRWPEVSAEVAAGSPVQGETAPPEEAEDDEPDPIDFGDTPDEDIPQANITLSDGSSADGHRIRVGQIIALWAMYTDNTEARNGIWDFDRDRFEEVEVSGDRHRITLRAIDMDPASEVTYEINDQLCVTNIRIDPEETF